MFLVNKLRCSNTVKVIGNCRAFSAVRILNISLPSLPPSTPLFLMSSPRYARFVQVDIQYYSQYSSPQQSHFRYENLITLIYQSIKLYVVYGSYYFDRGVEFFTNIFALLFFYILLNPVFQRWYNSRNTYHMLRFTFMMYDSKHVKIVQCLCAGLVTLLLMELYNMSLQFQSVSKLNSGPNFLQNECECRVSSSAKIMIKSNWAHPGIRHLHFYKSDQ